ncbi:MAG TPA: 50S ribosomal protein L22 [Pontiellaceae bacterium]|nr:50S ribosomal protein L22 [Pontiellaceae bacterium]HPR82440.1 50S ribosomal protein L22 [Pontiellaceae bacterium]
MEVSATTKYVRMSPIKARFMASSIRGLSVAEALRITSFNAMKAAAEIGKTLKSAAANAESNEGVSADKLFIKDAYVDEGPALKRSRPRARGSASPIRKRTSHITVVLTDRK